METSIATSTREVVRTEEVPIGVTVELTFSEAALLGVLLGSPTVRSFTAAVYNDYVDRKNPKWGEDLQIPSTDQRMRIDEIGKSIRHKVHVGMGALAAQERNNDINDCDIPR